MERSADDEQRLSTAANDVLHLTQTRMRNFRGRSGEAVRRAHFLNGRGRDREELPAHPKENDLFGAGRAVLRWRRRPHYRTPTGAMRARLSTRFSRAA